MHSTMTTTNNQDQSQQDSPETMQLNDLISSVEDMIKTKNPDLESVLMDLNDLKTTISGDQEDLPAMSGDSSTSGNPGMSGMIDKMQYGGK